MRHEPTSRERTPRIAHTAGVVLLLAVFAALCVHGMAWDSPTVDEFAHLPAGYVYLTTGSFELYAKNPPLVKVLSALPLLALRPDIAPPERVPENAWYPTIFATDFMERNRERYLELFFWGRLPIVVLGILLGLLVHRWARELYGDRAALVALALYAFCPSVVAHAHLATVDVGAAFFMTLALWLFRRFTERPEPGRLALCGVALGLAQLAKFTAVLLYPVLALLTLAVLLQGGRLPPAPSWDRRGRVLPALASLAGIVLVSLATTGAGYLFQGIGRPLGEFKLHSRLLAGAAAALPASLPVPLPAIYVGGFDAQLLDTEAGEFPNYLLGRWSRDAFPTYYLVALLVKTPLPLLLALLAAPFAPLRHRRAEAFLWMPALLLLAAFTFLSRLDLGIRYILPVFPLAFVYAGRLVPWLAGLPGRRGRILRAAAAIGLGLYPASILAATPDTIDYFNRLARGRGDEILLDSNLDWGQGLPRLRAYLDREGIGDIGLAYFGHVDPGLYGIRWHFPDPQRDRLVAVSANFLHGYPYATYAGGRIALVPPDAFAWLARFPRAADLGGGIYVVRLR